MRRQTVKVILVFAALQLVIFGSLSLTGFFSKHNPTPKNQNSQTLPAPQAATPSTNQFHWRQVESADYRIYIANLRGIGCPDETVRDIIIADVNKLYAARHAELLREDSRRNWWQPKQRHSLQRQTAAQQSVREIEAEKRALIRELLGIELEEEKYLAPAKNSPDLNFLPAEKREAVRTVFAQFTELEQSVLDEANLADGGPDWQKLRTAYQQREAELAKLLSPAELEEFQLRHDEVAESLRQHLAAFHPTEQEFRELFRTLKKHDDAFAFTDPNDEQVTEQRRADFGRTTEQIRALLGEQRYAEYQRAQTYEFQNLFWLTQQYDLPEESAIKIYDANKSARERLAKLQADASLTDEQKAANLRALQEQLQAAIQNSLGDRAYRYFQRWGNAHWMQN